MTLLHQIKEDKVTTLTTIETRSTTLPTAITKLLDGRGNESSIRCLVDLCAERTYVTENIAQKLKLKRQRINIKVSGINGMVGKVSACTTLRLKLNENEVITVEALIVPTIVSDYFINNHPMMDEFESLQLADPFPRRPGAIGALLGVDIATKLYLQNVPNKITKNGILLQPTKLGWLTSGKVTPNTNQTSTLITTNESLEKLNMDHELNKRILEFYEIPDTSITENDEYCENLYRDNHYRLKDGRYVVPVPWKQETKKLGSSYHRSMTLFKSQEARWEKNKNYYEMSNKFMQEYQLLGNMSRIKPKDEKSNSNSVHYIPYHSIIKENAVTTKLRNVFNASAPSDNKVSLNDAMYDGPKLQSDLSQIILTARSFKHIYSADISKMFRQIFVTPNDRDKQRIIWRPHKNCDLREYRLNTVTYGTDSAPFLAIRTIHQCAEDNATEEIAEIIIDGN